jgi:hypothetical protein
MDIRPNVAAGAGPHTPHPDPWGDDELAGGTPWWCRAPDGAWHDQPALQHVARRICRQLHVVGDGENWVSVAMLLLAPKLVQPLSWPALLVGLVVCMKVYWVALLVARAAMKNKTNRDRRAWQPEQARRAHRAGEYIVHHLSTCRTRSRRHRRLLTVFNLDSIFFAVLLGVMGCFLLWRVARKATSGVPGRFQAAVEILVEMVDSQAKGIVHNARAASWWPRWR